MFKNLTDFSMKRNKKEAFGFYLAYLFLCMILSGIAGGVFAAGSNFSEGFASGARIGARLSVLYSLVIAVLLLIRKGIYKNFGYLLLALLSGVLAIFGGGILGLVIPAFMTTRDNSSGGISPE